MNDPVFTYTIIRRDRPEATINGSGTFPEMVNWELSKARTKHPKINSTHEGYAILLEEVDEFKELVWKDGPRSEKLLELAQIGAMAQRIAEDLLQKG